MASAYKKLIVWEIADRLVNLIYDFSTYFPKAELYGITSQIRRAAMSVVANIIEGHVRNNKNEFRHFLSIALGSLAEVEYYLEFAYKRGYLSKTDFEKVESVRRQCGQLLWKLYQTQSRTI